MFNSWHFKYALTMGALFMISVGYNACSNDAGFDLADGVDSITQFNNDEEVEAKPDPQPSILINNGAQYTNDSRVNLSLDPDGPADSMLISDRPDCSTGAWENYQNNKQWDLSAVNQETSVYVKYKYSDEPETNCVEDKIIHDDVAPVVNFTQGVGSVWISDRNINIAYVATDSGSGVNFSECDTAGNGSYSVCGTNMFFANMVENRNYFLIVRSQDNAGNVSAPQRLNWRPDYTAPTITFNTTPAALTADITPNFAFQGTDLGSGIKSYSCRLDNQVGFTPCQNTLTLSGLTDGQHTLHVKTEDNVGFESSVISYTWEQDSMAPTVEFTQTPGALSGSTTAHFAFREVTGGLVGFECRLDSGAYQVCSSPNSLTGLSEGSHTFSVLGYDAAGNKSQPISYTWMIDATAPSLQIVETPMPIDGSTDARFTFATQDSGSGVREIQCAIDGGAMQVCSTTMVFPNLSEGAHSIQARAIDNAGNPSQYATYSWSIDLTAPTVQITQTPSNPSSEVVANFEFTGTDSGSGIRGYECRLDGQAYAACNPMIAYSGLTDGTHSFSVRAIDNVGNISQPASYQWTVDTMAPVVTLVLSPNPVEYIGSTPQINFTVSDNGSGVASVICFYQNNPFACQPDQTYDFGAVVEGNNTFTITVTDNVGNSDTQNINWQVQYNVVPAQTTLTIDGERPVDILFIVDNSGSMDTERKNLGQNLNGMLNQIGNVDWQVAVTTTDMSGSLDHEDGRLANFDGNGLHILDSAMDRNLAQQLFEGKVTKKSNSFPLGIPTGSGTEQGLFALDRVMERAILNNSNINQINDAFLRDGADLVAVVLSDENEYSNGNPADVKYQPQEILDRFNARYQGSKSLTFHSIIVRPGDTVCKAKEWDHRYGTLYASLTTLTGGILGDLCDTNYTTQLQDIGDSVANLAKTVSLDCAPLDTDNDGLGNVSVQFKGPQDVAYSSFNWAYAIQGQKLVYQQFLPEGDFIFDYQCNQ